MIGEQGSRRIGTRLRALPVLAALTVLVAVAPAHAAKQFENGVAAGEITDKSVRIWAQALKQGKVTAEVATDKRFRHVVATKKATAKSSADKTVQTTIKGLDPGRGYSYHFCRKGKCSKRGSFETAPKANSNDKITFAVSGDADASVATYETEPFFGHFLTFRSMMQEQNDFNVYMGDTIYSDSGVNGSPPALTRQQKWVHYRRNLGQKNLTKLRASGGLYTHWDDHEFINDFTRAENGEQIYKAGVDAFRDYAPVTYKQKTGLYRSFRWGRNLEVFFLDERSFRSAKASANGVCDNPDTPGEPDLAPTAPPGKRTIFSALIPSLSQPVSQACKDEIDDPQRTMLGSNQYDRFLSDLKSSNARWKLIMNETPIQQFYGLPYDRWEGYAYERQQLLDDLQAANLDNVVFFTTDTHAAFANVVRERSFADDVSPSNAPAAVTDTPFQDFVIGPVATNTFWNEIDSTTGTPGAGAALSAAFFKPAPPTGVGMFCAQGDVNSYAQITVDKKKVTVEYKNETGGPVTDSDNSSTCGPYVING